MTPYEYMQKQVRGVAGGIAWAHHMITRAPGLAAADLVDTAVDIAWERLMPKTLERPELDISQRGNLIVFRLKDAALRYAPARAA